MKAVLLGLVLGIAGLSVKAQHAPNPAPPEQSHYAPASTQKMRELACREQAARDMQKPVTLPPGTTRAWELERVQRERLCLAQAAAPNEAEPQTHRHYKAKDRAGGTSALKSNREFEDGLQKSPYVGASYGDGSNGNAPAAPSQHPDCSGIERWATRMAYVQLKNAGIMNSGQINPSKTKTVRLASEKIGDDEYRQIHQVAFTRTDGSEINVITSNIASNEECSLSAVDVFIVSAPLSGK
jgi:hypothetical protein